MEGGEVALRSRVRKCGRGRGEGVGALPLSFHCSFLFLLVSEGVGGDRKEWCMSVPLWRCMPSGSAGRDGGNRGRSLVTFLFVAPLT